MSRRSISVIFGPGSRNGLSGPTGFVGKRLLAILAVVLLIASVTSPSIARSRHAEMVVDGESGRVLVARNADARKYPASLTKIMTLYMVF